MTYQIPGPPNPAHFAHPTDYSAAMAEYLATVDPDIPILRQRWQELSVAVSRGQITGDLANEALGYTADQLVRVRRANHR